MSTYFRTRACETSTSSGTIAPGRAKRARRMAFGTFALAPSALGASSIAAGFVDDERERTRVHLGDGLPRLEGHHAADLHAADGDAERDRRRRRGRRLDRWLRRRRFGRRRRLRGLPGRGRSGTGSRSEPESGCKSDESQDHEESRPQMPERTVSRSQCRRQFGRKRRGSFVTIASTPAASTRISSAGVVDRPRDDRGAPAMRGPHARIGHERVVQHERARACHREERSNEDRGDTTQHAQDEPGPERRATPRIRDAKDAAWHRESRTDVAVVQRDGARGSEVVRADEGPVREAVSAHRCDHVDLSLGELQVEMDSDRRAPRRRRTEAPRRASASPARRPRVRAPRAARRRVRR